MMNGRHDLFLKVMVSVACILIAAGVVAGIANYGEVRSLASTVAGMREDFRDFKNDVLVRLRVLENGKITHGKAD